MSRPDRRDPGAGPPAESRERVMRRVFEKLDAMLPPEPLPAPPPPRLTMPPATQATVTRRSPSLVLAAVPSPSVPPPIPPQASAPAPPIVKRTEPMPRVAGIERSGTTPSGDDSIARARAVMPFPRMPSLTVQQYVSLCFDLACWPAEAYEIMRRYRVRDEATLTALRAHWEERRSRSAALRAEWSAAEETYREWLRKVLRM